MAKTVVGLVSCTCKQLQLQREDERRKEVVNFIGERAGGHERLAGQKRLREDVVVPVELLAQVESWVEDGQHRESVRWTAYFRLRSLPISAASKVSSFRRG